MTPPSSRISRYSALARASVASGRSRPASRSPAAELQTVPRRSHGQAASRASERAAVRGPAQQRPRGAEQHHLDDDGGQDRAGLRGQQRRPGSGELARRFRAPLARSNAVAMPSDTRPVEIARQGCRARAGPACRPPAAGDQVHVREEDEQQQRDASVTRRFSPRRAVRRSSTRGCAGRAPSSGSRSTPFAHEAQEHILQLTGPERGRERLEARASSQVVISTGALRGRRAQHVDPRLSTRTWDGAAQPREPVRAERRRQLQADSRSSATCSAPGSRRSQGRLELAAGHCRRRHAAQLQPAVSPASSRPRSMIATRSASASASSSRWVVSRMVVPPSRSSRSTAQVSRRAWASIAPVGSSRIASLGRPTIASARLSRCRSPPDRSR